MVITKKVAYFCHRFSNQQSIRRDTWSAVSICKAHFASFQWFQFILLKMNLFVMFNLDLTIVLINVFLDSRLIDMYKIKHHYMICERKRNIIENLPSNKLFRFPISRSHIPCIWGTIFSNRAPTHKKPDSNSSPRAVQWESFSQFCQDYDCRRSLCFAGISKACF